MLHRLNSCDEIWELGDGGQTLSTVSVLQRQRMWYMKLTCSHINKSCTGAK